MTGAPADRERPVLVTGATGYIGGRLVPRLLAAGHRVRCLVRDPRKLAHRPWRQDPNAEVVACDLENPTAVGAAMAGCGTAFYLVHSMLAAGRAYAQVDRHLARTFADAAAAAGLGRIIYLGGLGETGEGLSEHLRSRRDVEASLAAGPVPVTVLRAAMIIGAGSASFEILRYLVERLPVMVTPRWVRTKCQPIAVSDVLHYLTACLDQRATTGQTLDIGGPDVVTYLDVIQLMAKLRGLPQRWVVPVPVLTPHLSSLWIHLVTPISGRIARPLAEGLRNEVVCRNDHVRRLMPHMPLTMTQSITAALGGDQQGIETRWSDAGLMPGDPDWAGGTRFVDPREVEVQAPAAAVYRAVCRVGGGHGWYSADWLWRLRGFLDKLVGGPGLRRGRRDAEHVDYGEALDFWRVTDVVPNRRLELFAEMKLPGVATLTFDIVPDASRPNSCLLRQTARFQPKGLLGLAYWYAVLPLHGFVFRGMLAGIRRTAEALARSPLPITREQSKLAEPPNVPVDVP